MRRGLTLLELILVLAVIAIAGGLSFPLLFGESQRRGLAVATGTLAAHLEQARSFGLFGLAQPGATFTAGLPTCTIAGGKPAILENGCIAVGNVSVQFASLGQLIDPAADLAVTIRDPSSGQDGVITVATTGMITWTTP